MRCTGVRYGLLSLLLTVVGLLAGCGGGSGGGAVASGGGSDNVQPVTVAVGPSHTVNLLFTSVTVCTPGTSTECATIDHVQVDTGSSGLRIIASQLPPSLTLPQQTDGGNNAIAECAQFADGYAWGPVKLANVKIAGEGAVGIPIQVIDGDFGTVPDDCSSTGPAENTVTSFGANGVLGVGEFLQDCGSACATITNNGFYYPCPQTSGCLATTVSAMQPLAQQVANPVAAFANDNNGILIRLPPISPDGAVSVSGSLIFGIDTQTNNTLGSAQVFTTSGSFGTFTTIYKGNAYRYSLFDSGSSSYFFSDATIPVCPSSDPYAPGFYCPTSTLELSAIIHGAGGESATRNFSVANAHDLSGNNPDYWAFDNLGTPNAGSSDIFIWGLPAFFGHTVYTAIEGRATSAGSGPFFAF